MKPIQLPEPDFSIFLALDNLPIRIPDNFVRQLLQGAIRGWWKK